MVDVTNAQIEELRARARQMSAVLPMKKPRSIESRVVDSLFFEIETLKNLGHSWPSIAEQFGQGLRWRSLQSSYARAKKLRTKSKKSPPSQVTPPAPNYVPPGPPAAPLPLPPGVLPPVINNR